MSEPRSARSASNGVEDRPRTKALDLAVVVPSCDAYEDIWPSFFETFFTRWPDCPFPLYLVSNHLDFPDPRVTPLKVGDDLGWSANLRKALRVVPEEHVLLAIDDLHPTAHIDTDSVVSLIEEVGDFDYLRLNPYPGPRKALSERVGLVPVGDVYRTSTVFSVWRRRVLSDLLVEHESPWEFELNGSERSDRFDRWFASRRWLIPYVNLVVKRKIDPLALRLLQEGGIQVRSPRQRLSAAEALLLRLRELRARIFALVPWRMQRRIRGHF